MGLSYFSNPSEGILPLLVMDTVMSVNHVKNMLRPFLQVVIGATAPDQESEEEYSGDDSVAKRVSVKCYSSRWRNQCDGGGNKWAAQHEDSTCALIICRIVNPIILLD
ncbi:uncharacterized protein LOC142532425 [Primulina tabacum]|uniref:uncharacterized protein LOC142532425 n=1 Tax=Primulina tabacum TaxID=48773 RepID=UPI003F5AA532